MQELTIQDFIKIHCKVNLFSLIETGIQLENIFIA